jgi:hypothetical protein
VLAHEAAVGRAIIAKPCHRSGLLSERRRIR